MTTAILIFTFGPIQPFIGEARRASDLYTGSQILVELSRAAASTLATEGSLIYPSSIEGKDVPNRLVAKVDWDRAEEIGENARLNLFKKWTDLANASKEEFLKIAPQPDDLWEKIWGQQVDNENIWEIFWAAAENTGDYKTAYDKADRAVAALKRERPFKQVTEQGEKDTLSGTRQALRTADLTAKQYWREVGKRTSSSRIHPDGRERLDAIGVIKRFSPIARRRVAPYNGFPSVSSIAAENFVHQSLHLMQNYNNALKAMDIFTVQDRENWQFDGAFLYPETLEPRSLERDYQVTNIDPGNLERAKKELSKLLSNPEITVTCPSYYAIVALDGDSMGKTITSLLDAPNPENAHKEFSNSLSSFSSEVGKIAGKHNSTVVYNGGDDVLAFSPLSSAFPLAQELATTFNKITKGTASAGIVIAHIRYPLSSALAQAKDAEHRAKSFDKNGKDAISITVLKRSGVPKKLTAHWDEIGPEYTHLISIFEENKLPSRFAYKLLESTHTLHIADELFLHELNRQLGRSGQEGAKLSDEDIEELAAQFFNLSKKLPGGSQDLANWFIIANFIAEGGRV